MLFHCCGVVIDTCIWSGTREVDYATGIGRIGPVSTTPIVGDGDNRCLGFVGDGDNRCLGYGIIIANTLYCCRSSREVEQKEELGSVS
jgi:hypothetical protein